MSWQSINEIGIQLHITSSRIGWRDHCYIRSPPTRTPPHTPDSWRRVGCIKNERGCSLVGQFPSPYPLKRTRSRRMAPVVLPRWVTPETQYRFLRCRNRSFATTRSTSSVRYTPMALRVSTTVPHRSIHGNRTTCSSSAGQNTR